MDSMDLIKLIPEKPPEDLVSTMRKQERWWLSGVMAFKCMGREEAESLLEFGAIDADCRCGWSNIRPRIAHMVCSECQGEILADYIPRQQCHYGLGLGGVSLGRGMGNCKHVVGDFQESSDMRCPICGEQVTLLRASTLRGYEEQHSMIVPVVREKHLILMEWSVSRHFSPNGASSWRHQPVSAHIFHGGSWKKCVKARKAPFNGGLYTLEHWEQLKSVKDTLGAPYMYMRDLPNLEGTDLENAKLWEYARQTYEANAFFPLAYVRLYRRHWQVENLITAGLGWMVGQEIDEECSTESLYSGRYTTSPKLSWINWKETKPSKMLGLSKAQVKAIRHNKWTHKELEFFHEQNRWKFEEVDAALKAVSLSVLRGIYGKELPLQKTLNYMKKQGRDWNYLNDYWRMAARAELDLSQDVVRWPPHLRQAHDRLAETVRYKTSEKQRRDFAEMTQRCRSLAWEHDGICIRPAETPEELVQEGQTLHHCVGGYSSSHAEGKIILFIRHTRRPERSWYTLNVDVRTKKIIQNHGYGNERSPSGEHLTIPQRVQDFVALWAKEVLAPWQLPTEKPKSKPAA